MATWAPERLSSDSRRHVSADRILLQTNRDEQGAPRRSCPGLHPIGFPQGVCYSGYLSERCGVDGGTGERLPTAPQQHAPRRKTIMRELDRKFAPQLVGVITGRLIQIKPPGPRARSRSAILEWRIQSLEHEAVNPFVEWGLGYSDYVAGE